MQAFARGGIEVVVLILTLGVVIVLAVVFELEIIRWEDR